MKKLKIILVLITVIQIALIVCKVLGILTPSWWIILIPALISAACVIYTCIIITVFAYIIAFIYGITK